MYGSAGQTYLARAPSMCFAGTERERPPALQICLWVCRLHRGVRNWAGGGSLSLSRKMLCAWRFFPDQSGFYLSREETGFSSRERILPVVLPKSFSLGREADASWSKDRRRTLRGKEWVFLMPCFFCVPPRIVEGMGGASQHRVAASGRNALFVLCFYYR